MFTDIDKVPGVGNCKKILLDNNEIKNKNSGSYLISTLKNAVSSSFTKGKRLGIV